MPNGTAAVSPWTISTSSNGTCSSSAASWAKVVSCPCPWLWEPVKTVIFPVGVTRTCALSQRPACAPRAPATWEGAGPQASM